MQTVGGCTAICDANSTDTSCSGINCCQTTMPERPQEFQYSYRSIEASNKSRYCGYAFPADKKWIPSAYTLHSGLNQDPLNPYDAGFRFAQLVIDWERVGFEDFHDNTICKVFPQGRSDEYIDDYYTPRYDATGINYVSSTRYCYCRDGYEGNPYLGRDGCVDVDECSNSTLNVCGGNGDLHQYYRRLHLSEKICRQNSDHQCWQRGWRAGFVTRGVFCHQSYMEKNEG